MFYVYLLECTDKSTYVGATVDLEHRLRQHNKEIAGGARATSIKVAEGHAWERVLYVSGFPDWKTALQFEWAFKFYSRKYPKRMYPLERRLRGLYDLLCLEKSTSKSTLYHMYPTGGPIIHWESEEAKTRYETLFPERVPDENVLKL
jgi:structure-specific endonuclease subunit SLX1